MKRLISVGLIVLFFILSFYLFDFIHLLEEAKKLIFFKPASLLLMTVLYATAFLLRAIAWWLYLNKKASFHICLGGLFHSMFFNHILPFKAGEAVRIGTLVKARNIPFTKAVQSVVILRLLDTGILLLLSFVGFFVILQTVPFETALVTYLFLALGIILITIFLMRKKRHTLAAYFHGVKETLLSKKGAIIISLIFLSWLFEGAVIYTILFILTTGISPLSAIWLNSVTVISGLFQVTPGGIATYESVMSVALVKIGFSMKQAYTLAILSHAYKFIFSFIVGIIAFLLVPLNFTDIKKWIKEGVKGEEENENCI
jgi:uncharacterized membrane protein YbhN (UPF0104 family)